MKKKIKLKLRLIDVFIVILCLSVFIFCIHFFWKDLNSYTTRNDKDAIATIVFKQRIAQRKFSDRVVWERLQNNAPLYNEDSLRTSTQSEAIITFKNNSVIEIGENTMLQVFYSEDGGVHLNIEDGNIDIDTSSMNESEKSTVSVKIANGSVINLSSGSKMSANTKTETGVTSFNIQEGNAIIKDNKGAETKLLVGETAKIEKNGEISKGIFNVTSIPNNLKILNFEENKTVPIQLEWNKSQEVSEKSVIIQTSQKKDFSKIENTYTVEDINSFTLPVENGTLYWRAYLEDSENQNKNDEKKSEINESEKIEGKIRVEKIIPIQTISPKNGTNFSFRKDLPKISFSWEGNDFATKYKLEISSTADFSSPIICDEISVENISYNSLSEGTYFWRITPFYSINDTGFAESSEVKTFSVVKNEIINPPSLTIPTQNAILNYKNTDFNVSFIWKSDEKLADYDFIISKDEKFENIVYESQVKENRIYQDFSKILPIGKYFWKVRQNSLEEGKNQSEIREFSVMKYVPETNRLVYPPNNFSVEKTKITSTNFMWKLSDEYKNSDLKSIFQISTDLDFKNIILQNTTNQTSIKDFSLEKGKYYWRVGIFSEDENKEIFTNARIFNVLDELGSPKITFPPENENFVLPKNSILKINWTSVQDADFYKVKILNSKDNSIIYEKIVSSNSVQDFVIPSFVNLENSKFEVFVQAFTEQTDENPMRQGKITSTKFEIRTPEPVKLISPQNFTNIEGLNALKNPILLEWKSGKDIPTKTTFILKKVLSSGNSKEIQRIENVKNQIKLERLSSGTYEWTILASSKEGFSLNAEKYNTFVVKSVSKLQKPVLTSPKNDFLIDSSYLRKNRNIVFSWEEVLGATDYTFTLYQRNDDGTIRQIYTEKNIKNNSIKFKKLSNLDVGNFEWNVTAFSHAKDGFEEQSGITSVGKFKIQFNLPQKVKTNNPGRIYGE